MATLEPRSCSASSIAVVFCKFVLWVLSAMPGECAGAPGAADVAVPVVVASSSSGGSGTSPSKLQFPASQLSAAYEVACNKQQGAGLAQLLQASCTSSCAPDGSVALHGLLAVPAPVLTFKPILAKSVSLQSLAKALQGTLRPGAAPAPFQVQPCLWMLPTF